MEDTQDSSSRGSLSLKLKNCTIVDLLKEIILKSTVENISLKSQTLRTLICLTDGHNEVKLYT